MKQNLKFKFFQKKQTFFKNCLLLFFTFLAINGFSSNENLTLPSGDGPVEITAHLHINKIYNINTVDETFQIDGYLEYSWFDERVKLIDDFSYEPSIYENEKAKELFDTKIWFPAFELINVQGSVEIPNVGLEIYPNGKIIYEVRFFGTFSNPMNFRNFPFDSQNFNIQIEAFSYDSNQLIFINPDMFLDSSNDSFSEKWDILNMVPTINEQVYPEDNAEDEVFSRVIFEIDAKRKTGYYLWQVLFPLFIIIMASFAIFWIKEFSTQIGIGFTLMLTVVAFNFYSASILPKLPYQTFIEVIIIVGYIFIFLGIIAVIINHRQSRNDDDSDNNRLMKILRFVFPITFFAALIVLFFLYGVS